MSNETDIREVLNRYAIACDKRDWNLFEDVFIPDVAFSYGGSSSVNGRDKLTKMIRNSLGGCGPTQHLLGNFSIAVNGDSATCHCYVRAFHVGQGSMQGQIYEALGEYHDHLVKHAGVWKISERKFLFITELGSRSVLRPAGT